MDRLRFVLLGKVGFELEPIDSRDVTTMEQIREHWLSGSTRRSKSIKEKVRRVRNRYRRDPLPECLIAQYEEFGVEWEARFTQAQPADTHREALFHRRLRDARRRQREDVSAKTPDITTSPFESQSRWPELAAYRRLRLSGGWREPISHSQYTFCCRGTVNVMNNSDGNHMKAFTFFNDPGHAWLRVSMADLAEVELTTDSFSIYSYQDGETLYLEEDLDAGVFLEAADKAYGEDGITILEHPEDAEWIRSKSSLLRRAS